MNLLSSLLNLFRKRPGASTETDERWFQGYNAFEAGKKLNAERRTQEALDCFDTAVEYGFEDGTLFSSRGSCLQMLEWHLDAIDDFTKAISLEPQDCNHYFQRAMSKSSTGDQQGFLSDLQEAIRLSKVDNRITRNHNLGAKEMGWSSATALYEDQVAHRDIPDFIRDKLIERTKLKGRRKDKL